MLPFFLTENPKAENVCDSKDQIKHLVPDLGDQRILSFGK
jgi:hypothetical protein